MFNRLSTILFPAITLAGVAIAVPTALEVRDDGGISQCNTGSMQCCTNTLSSESTFISQLFGLLSIPVPTSSEQVRVSCSPTTLGGIGGGSACTQQPVCCTGNTFNGFISMGCSPITINF